MALLHLRQTLRRRRLRLRQTQLQWSSHKRQANQQVRKLNRRPIPQRTLQVKQRQDAMGLIGTNVRNGMGIGMGRRTLQSMQRMGGKFFGRGQQQLYAIRQRRRRHGGGITLHTDSSLWRSIGMRLAAPLKPNRDRIDLFNKEVRSQIVKQYILSNDGLRNMGVGPANQFSQAELSFPDQMKPIFAISIRPTRFENLRARLGPWDKFLTLWAGTNGEILDKARMLRDGTAVARLKRGEIGCYDSHYRLWKHIVENNIPHAFILEDDADIHYGQETLNRINHMFAELHRHGVPYDLVYLGHNTNKRPKRMIGASLGVPAGTQGLFMYYVTIEGARRLLEHAMPMTQAVDDYVYVSNKRVRQVTLEPRLGYVVSIERSDTANII